MGNPGYQEGGRMNSAGRLGIRVFPFAPSLRGSHRELRFITCGDRKMLESMITFLILMFLSFLLFTAKYERWSFPLAILRSAGDA